MSTSTASTVENGARPSNITQHYGRARIGYCLAVSVIGAAATAGVALADAGHKRGAAGIGEPAATTAANRTVLVTLGDNFFKPDSIDVKRGDVVKFVVKNTGEFLHEFNLGTPAMHAEHQKEMATMMEHGRLTLTGSGQPMTGMDHSQGGAGHAMSHDDPNSILVNPGETKELVWSFSKRADLEFACNVPGHYASGMVGKILFRR